MKLEKAPLATAGLVLGLLGLGNVLSDVSLVFTASCGILALVTLVYLIYIMMTDPQSVKNQISNPLVSSVFTTFFMSGFLGTVYLKNFFGEKSFYCNAYRSTLVALFLWHCQPYAYFFA